MKISNIQPPNFFIIGAPKCGTTALSEYLRSHPNVYFSEPKEPNYFNSDVISRKIYHYTSLEDYLEKCFSGSQGYAAVGEGSVRYLASTKAVPAILNLWPHAKFIVMLRNPVDLGYSLFHQHLRNENENVATYEEAWGLQESRRSGNNIPATCAHPSLLQYSARCKLGDQLEKLFATIPNRNNILVISFNDFTRNTQQVYERVLNFLELPSDRRTEFPPINEYSAPRSAVLEKILGVKKLPLVREISKKIKSWLGITHWPLLLWITRSNYKKLEKIPMSPEFRTFLTEYFRSDVEKVKQLTGIDLYAK
jgi:hypothetical protein